MSHNVSIAGRPVTQPRLIRLLTREGDVYDEWHHGNY